MLEKNKTVVKRMFDEAWNQGKLEVGRRTLKPKFGRSQRTNWHGFSSTPQTQHPQFPTRFPRLTFYHQRTDWRG